MQNDAAAVRRGKCRACSSLAPSVWKAASAVVVMPLLATFNYVIALMVRPPGRWQHAACSVQRLLAWHCWRLWTAFAVSKWAAAFVLGAPRVPGQAEENAHAHVQTCTKKRITTRIIMLRMQQRAPGGPTGGGLLRGGPGHAQRRGAFTNGTVLPLPAPGAGSELVDSAGRLPRGAPQHPFVHDTGSSCKAWQGRAGAQA